MGLKVVVRRCGTNHLAQPINKECLTAGAEVPAVCGGKIHSRDERGMVLNDQDSSVALAIVDSKNLN